MEAASGKVDAVIGDLELRDSITQVFPTAGDDSFVGSTFGQPNREIFFLGVALPFIRFISFVCSRLVRRVNRHR